jgi:hypothetical protein
MLVSLLDMAEIRGALKGATEEKSWAEVREKRLRRSSVFLRETVLRFCPIDY